MSNPSNDDDEGCLGCGCFLILRAIAYYIFCAANHLMRYP